MIDFLRGHKIETNAAGEWVYSSDKAGVKENFKKRPCGACGKAFSPEGHDPCIGTLPNVKNACCGHDIEADAYVQFNDGVELRGLLALQFFKRNPLKL